MNISGYSTLVDFSGTMVFRLAGCAGGNMDRCGLHGLLCRRTVSGGQTEVIVGHWSSCWRMEPGFLFSHKAHLDARVYLWDFA